MAQSNCVQLSVVAHTDGACAGNPGPMGLGGVLRDQHGKLIAQFSEPAGKGTNNEAEYLACLRALELAQEHGADSVVVKVDSQLLARQVSGEYAVRAANIRPLFKRVQQALKAFSGQARVEWVRREQNVDADALASAAVGMPQAVTTGAGVTPYTPDPGFQPDPEALSALPAAPASLVRLLNNPNPKFGDFVSLRVGGKDAYSDYTPAELEGAIIIRFGQAAAKWLEAALRGSESAYANNARRWCARGLQPDLALKKASVDVEMSARTK